MSFALSSTVKKNRTLKWINCFLCCPRWGRREEVFSRALERSLRVLSVFVLVIAICQLNTSFMNVGRKDLIIAFGNNESVVFTFLETVIMFISLKKCYFFLLIVSNLDGIYAKSLINVVVKFKCRLLSLLIISVNSELKYSEQCPQYHWIKYYTHRRNLIRSIK